ncbi:RHS repeat-associated core domain-containing protein [Sphingobacterium spiritivorum]|uniref:RHS repeat-associated core domain protein n=1 Tax=Sphingobacterium spiritivorum ATCC 33861 TaxID=525373 RepID=D7VQG6_SPHSI|nr:RHS repeat-associated core domain-containing protein [Sphingobacterium spiritivorum]EFK56017.1 RHS repeat-associated core domain protein [Sphingobacterium spiritivorum ATCC 33861]QQT35851.1 RHS repeat-associated core domain-containing protein [Sphingobacterium spiritivorum]WQD32577.1 RHS repeat-associated core domain-containing protein [Sphingobacterium spiritivorum]SUJ11183.1 RHS repeat-associated core domain [Sphingobacterium spiritivorum]
MYAANRIGTYYRQAGNYQYTLTDHLGNTRVVINRNKLSNGEADVVYYADYYPFGMVLRSGGVEGRYGYQGQYAEKDGETGWNNFELRNYDAAIGRWLTVDPYGQYYSPYVGMGNNPVSGVDPNGGWNDGGGLWGWLKGVFSSKEDVAARIVLEEAVVTRVVKAKPAYETFGVRVDHIQQPTLSATKPDPYRTSYSHRQMMYNYSQMLANTNYNDLSNPTTSLAISRNIANFGVVEIATIKVIGRVGSLYNAFAKEGSSGASLSTNGVKLSQHLEQLEKYRAGEFKELANGRFRYYGQATLNRGDANSFRMVREWDPATGGKRTWFETLNPNGGVIQVRPEFDTGVKTHYLFNGTGGYLGKW